MKIISVGSRGYGMSYKSVALALELGFNPDNVVFTKEKFERILKLRENI